MTAPPAAVAGSSAPLVFGPTSPFDVCWESGPSPDAFASGRALQAANATVAINENQDERKGIVFPKRKVRVTT
jgi:hypothetical protein